MGYSYGSRGRCCDNCGRDGGTRLRTCPHRVEYFDGTRALPYCPAPALCSACYAEHKPTLHQDCAEGARLSTETNRRIADRKAAGERQVKAAWGDWHDETPAGMVRVVDHLGDYWIITADEYGARSGDNFVTNYPSAVAA